MSASVVLIVVCTVINLGLATTSFLRLASIKRLRDERDASLYRLLQLVRSNVEMAVDYDHWPDDRDAILRALDKVLPWLAPRPARATPS